jgi:hypothetical protein
MIHNRCHETLPFFRQKEVWPPSSPDYNPMDFFVCGVSEKDINGSPHNNILPLINYIMKVFSNFSRDDVERPCSQLQLKLREVVTSECDLKC